MGRSRDRLRFGVERQPGSIGWPAAASLHPAVVDGGRDPVALPSCTA